MEMSSIETSARGVTPAAKIKRMAFMLALVVAVVAAIVGYKMLAGSMQKKAMQARGGAVLAVSTISADVQEWVPEIAAVGSFRAVNGAELSLEVPGIVDEITFNSGDDVQAGQVLLRLRAQDEAAKLRALEAMTDLAATAYSRSASLTKTQAVSQATLDTHEANLKNARAQVAQQQAILDKKTVRAPFSGRLGLRAVDRGQYVNAGTPIVTLQALDPIFLDFFLPQQELDRVKVGQSIAVNIDTYPNEQFTGEIAAINPKVDSANRNVQIRAALRNADKRLLPGMFATAKVSAGVPVRYITVPQTSVIYSPYGDAVYVLDQKPSEGKDPQLVARFAFVTLGETRGNMVAVLSGVKEGETVVTAGATKLRNGALTRVDNTIQPATSTDPKPAIP
jgi:membrane fusion protein (multidrug efflux system)